MAKTKSKPKRIRKTKPVRKNTPSPKGLFHGLRTAVYFVDDIASAKTWYGEALGTKPYFDEPFYVGFNIGGYEFGLHPRSERYPGTPGSVAVYWGVTNAAESYQRLVGLGAAPYDPVEDVGGGIKVGTVKDPFGNILGIIENPHFKV